MFIYILFSSPNVDLIAVMGQDLLEAEDIEMTMHEQHMLEREKDAKPNHSTAKWRAMREVCKAVAIGRFFVLFCVNFLIFLYWADACSLSWVYVFSSVLLISSLNRLRELWLLF